LPWQVAAWPVAGSNGLTDLYVDGVALDLVADLL